MEKTVESKRVFEGRLLKVDVVDVELDDGSRSKREIVSFPPVVVVFPICDDGSVVCVRQFRKPIEPNIIIEAVAGKVDQGESPEAAAKRELIEETGYEARTMVRIGQVYPTCGYSTELQHVFLASVNDKPTFGQSEEDKGRTEIVRLSPQDFGKLMKSGDRLDAKLISAFALAMAWRTT